MGDKMRFVRISTSFEGLVARAWTAWLSFLEGPSDDYQIICVHDSQVRARCLEVLDDDLPEEDLNALVRRMPYLMLLFQRAQKVRRIPLEALFAFVSVLNLSGVATLMRQTSDRDRLAETLGMTPGNWHPVMFIMGGQPDLDRTLSDRIPDGFTFF